MLHHRQSLLEREQKLPLQGHGNWQYKAGWIKLLTGEQVNSKQHGIYVEHDSKHFKLRPLIISSLHACDNISSKVLQQIPDVFHLKVAYIL